MIRIEAPTYPVFIGRGLLGRAGELLPEGRHHLVTDENVAAAGWPDRLALAPTSLHVLPPGEAHKTLVTVTRLADALLDAGIARGDFVVALGGGMVGDVAGFVAAILKRGCGLVQVPTTLLAQADSAIGGKTGVNTRHGKNLLGAFHQPSAVLVDVDTLDTLPRHELTAGYAEVVKYGLVGDANFFAWCEAHGAALIAGDAEARLHAVETSVRTKLAAVTGDERDTEGRRALLNFGHSFGHAIESETGLPHGEAVAIGMAMAFRLSAARDLCPADDARRVEAHLRSAGLSARLPPVNPDALLARMAQDKKNDGCRMRLVLAEGIGRAFLAHDVTTDELAAFLDAEAS
ncbi:MAG: 3-dehydroquinate synthase [Sphingosinicella sp.]|uniref:3-dehydroquinate synthase n=1 Tax=Sphingosinicella sp. TaxID=1917971 RepID=UPI0040377A00